MKKLTALFIALVCVAAFSVAQEMPADIKSQLEAKSAELNPGNDSAAKKWLRQQTTAWESMQNMAFSASKSDIDMLKKAAVKKYPLDFVQQEMFLTSQMEFVGVLAEYRAKLGEESYEAIKTAYEAGNDFDLDALSNLLIRQSMAKEKIATVKPEGVDEITVTITKEVIAKKFPNDFIKQYDAMKEQFGILGDIADADSAQGAAGGANAAGAAGAKQRELTIVELNKLARDYFSQETLIVEGENRSSAIITEIKGKQVILAPISGYTTNVSIINAMGEAAEYTNNDVYASTTLPVVMILPSSLPSGLKPAKFINEKEYRELIGENIFFVGYSGTNIQSFPIRINAISTTVLSMSTRIPNNFAEGTLLINSRNDTVVGMAIKNPIRLPDVDWTQRSSVNKYARALNDSKGNMVCMRLDKLDAWQKVDPAKLDEQKKLLEKLSGISNDFISLLTSSKLEDAQNGEYIGGIVKKHNKEFKTRMEKVRFERMFRTYLREMASFINTEIRNVNVKDFYTLYRNDITQQIQTLESIQKAFDKAATGQITDMMPDDIKRNQNM